MNQSRASLYTLRVQPPPIPNNNMSRITRRRHPWQAPTTTQGLPQRLVPLQKSLLGSYLPPQAADLCLYQHLQPQMLPEPQQKTR